MEYEWDCGVYRSTEPIWECGVCMGLWSVQERGAFVLVSGREHPGSVGFLCWSVESKVEYAVSVGVQSMCKSG